MTYEHLTIRRTTSAMGATITDLDISKPLDKSIKDELYQAFLEYQLLFFPAQNLTPARQLEFSKIFGDAEFLPFVPDEARDPEVKEIEIFAQKEWGDAPPTDTFHIDVSSRDEPSKGAMLYAVEMPEAGGDTIWSNMYEAYDALSEPMKQLLDGRTASFPKMDFDTVERICNAEKWILANLKTFAHKPKHHPIVATHPETGRKSIYFDPFRTRQIDGLTRDESNLIGQFLRAHMTKPEFQCRWNWQQGDACVWDNRNALHKRVDDRFPGKRIFHRISLAAGQAPMYKAA